VSVHGILKLDISDFAPVHVLRHLCASGEGLEADEDPARCRGIALGEVDRVEYLFGTVGADFIYAAEPLAGRGLFAFDMPKHTAGPFGSRYGLGFGAGCLWVIERLDGLDYLLRVDVAGDPYAALQRNRRVRHVKMAMTTSPAANAPATGLGTVRHNHCLPPALPNQELDGGHVAVNLSPVSETRELESFSPSGDPRITQEIRRTSSRSTRSARSRSTSRWRTRTGPPAT